MTTTASLLARLDGALKALSVNDLGDSKLSPEQSDRFVRQAELATKVLPDARFYLMNAGTRNIDRIGFASWILDSGKDAGNETVVPDGVKPARATNQLVAQEMVAITGVEDDTLEENIERGNLEGTLLDIFGGAAGRDLEAFALLGDKEWDDTNTQVGRVLSRTDGWMKRAANRVYGRNVAGQEGRDFDPTAAYDPDAPQTLAFPENMFDSMVSAMPEQFFGDLAGLRIYVDFNTLRAYRALLKLRQTGLGDAAVRDDAPLFYEGIRVEYVPLLSRSPLVDLTSDAQVKRDRVEGACALLTHPSNLAWGIRRDMRIEPDRVPKSRKTDFVLTVRADADYEDENGAVAAFIDKANPALDGS